LPTLTVNTSDGYRPGLDDIIAFATTAAGLTAEERGELAGAARDAGT
jgi:hypothetical protein